MTPKVLYFVRHAQGEHNAKHDDSIPDAILTPHGKSQCHSLSSAFPQQGDVGLIVSSPLRRALQTSVFGFSTALRKEGVYVLLQPLAQEMNAYPCDIGTERVDLERQVKRRELWDSDVSVAEDKVVFDLVEEGWNVKKGKWAPDRGAVEKRAAELRSWLFGRKEETVVVVSHGGFLHALTEDWEGFDALVGTGWKNCEVREFAFSENSTEEDAHVVLKKREVVPKDGQKELHVVEEVKDVGMAGK